MGSFIRKGVKKVEKITITKAQAEAIEKCVSKEDLIKSKLVGLLEHGKDEPIAELTLETLVQALYIGYEVEEEFKVGDWVMHELSKWLGEVTRIYEDELNVLRLGDGYIWNKKYVRHATPEEIAEEKQRGWWARHGRNVYEFKEGDLIDHGKIVSEVTEVRGDLLWVKMNAVAGTLTKECYDQIKVICFAEDRKDMEA